MDSTYSHVPDTWRSGGHTAQKMLNAYGIGEHRVTTTTSQAWSHCVVILGVCADHPPIRSCQESQLSLWALKPQFVNSILFSSIYQCEPGLVT